MAIEWEETVETKRRVALVVDMKPSEPFDAPDEVRAATIDDLRRACEAVGGYQFHDWEAVHAICDEHGVSRETMGLDAQMMRPALARERVRELVVKLTEKEERYYQDALTTEAERNACLDALSEHVSPDATADTPRMVRPSSVLAGIRSLQGRLRDARSDLREHDAALEAAVERRSEEADASTEQARAILNAVPGEDIVSAARRTMASLARSVEEGEALRYDLSTIVDEAFGMQPVMTHEELLSFLESGLRERTRDLAAARARAEKAESRISKAEATSGVSLESVASAYAFACKKLGINPDSDNLGRGVVHATRERDDLRARLETAERLHSEAEAQVECRNALRYRIRSLEADLAAAQGRINGAETTAGTSIESMAVAYGFACASLGIPKGELAQGVSDAAKALDTLRTRIAELEAPLPEATVGELHVAYCAESTVHAGIRAVAERVRRERCLIARAVAGRVDVTLLEQPHGMWDVAVHARISRARSNTVTAAEVPAELARQLTEVGA